jgi:hypothetical protein
VPIVIPAASSEVYSVDEAFPTMRPPLHDDHLASTTRASAVEGTGSLLRSIMSHPRHSSPHTPSEWSLVHRDLLELTQGQRNDEKPHGSPIVEGCESFESCVALSKQYALKIDIDAIETVGRAQLALGNGLNSFTVSEHMSLIRRIGLRAALHELSSTLVACTLQPRSLLLVTPPPRHTPLPIAPHPT